MEKDMDKGKRGLFGKKHRGAGSVKQPPVSEYSVQEEPADYDFWVSRKDVTGGKSKNKSRGDSNWLDKLNKNKYNSRKKSVRSKPRLHKRRGRRVRKGPVAVLAVALLAVAVVAVGVGRGFGGGDGGAENFAEKYAGLERLNLPTYGERFWKEQLYIGKNVVAGDNSLLVLPRDEYEAYCMQMGGEYAVQKIAYLRSVAKGEVNVSYLRNWSVHSAKTGKKFIALSFDDGPNPKTLDQYLAILNKYDAHATFFMLGQNMQKYPEAVQKIVESGNEPATHTWSHKNFKKCSAQVISDDLHKSAEVFKQLVGYDLYLMRCPYGNITDSVRTLNKQMGVMSAMWNVDTLDWKRKNAQGIVNCVKNHTEDGNIILMHEGKALDLQALPGILAHLKNSGYEVVSVGELLWQAHLNGTDGTAQ